MAEVRARVGAERDAAIAAAETRIAEIRQRTGAERDAAIAARDAALAANRDTIDRIDSETRQTIAAIEKIIHATGLDPDRLTAPVATPDVPGPKGGPFIPWSEAAARAAGVESQAVAGTVTGLERLRVLREMLEHTPLRSPVERTEISSGFGYRRDPITGAAALHPGIDLRGPLNTPVFPTAMGVVIFAGWDGAYGNTVEIDHGFGIHTRYSHLQTIVAAVGDRPPLDRAIGLMGATGRATGVHLHYEVRLNGRLLNPINFLKAVHHVPEEDPNAAERRDAPDTD